MAHYAANRGLYTLMTSAVSGSTDLRAAVFVGTAPIKTVVADLNFLADVEALSGVSEAVASGYARIDLASVAITEDDGNDRVTLTAAAPTTAAIATGETWTMIAYYVEGASDAARPLISIDIPTSPLVTNGGTVTLPAFSMVLTNP